MTLKSPGNVTPMPEGLQLMGQSVRVHQNLNNGMWTVKHGKSPVFHVHSCCLKRCTFRVSKAGRASVIAAGVRAVHAWIEGIWCTPPEAYDTWLLASYNPFNGHAHFHYRGSMQPIYFTDYAVFTPMRELYVPQ